MRGSGRAECGGGESDTQLRQQLLIALGVGLAHQHPGPLADVLVEMVEDVEHELDIEALQLSPRRVANGGQRAVELVHQEPNCLGHTLGAANWLVAQA